MRSLDSVRRDARRRYGELQNWRKVGAAMGISEGMAWRLANEEGYEPKDAHIRVHLGLPALVPAPACVRCGEVHVTKRCVKRRKILRLYQQQAVR